MNDPTVCQAVMNDRPATMIVQTDRPGGRR